MSDSRPDPEQLLKQIEQDEQRQKRGRLKVFLGYASGVGKSASMFEEDGAGANAERMSSLRRYSPIRLRKSSNC